MIEINISLPKVRYAAKKWLDAMASKQRAKSLPALRNMFKQTVTGWSDKPDFGYAQTMNAQEISLKVYPKGPYSDIWKLVNAGSPPHRIDPKTPGGILAFRPGYRAATRPGSIQSGRKYRSGKYQFAKYIKRHPGFEARNFTEQIAQKFAEDFAMEMQEAVTEIAKTRS